MTIQIVNLTCMYIKCAILFFSFHTYVVLCINAVEKLSLIVFMSIRIQNSPFLFLYFIVYHAQYIHVIKTKQSSESRLETHSLIPDFLEITSI